MYHQISAAEVFGERQRARCLRKPRVGASRASWGVSCCSGGASGPARPAALSPTPPPSSVLRRGMDGPNGPSFVCAPNMARAGEAVRSLARLNEPCKP